MSQIGSPQLPYEETIKETPCIRNDRGKEVAYNPRNDVSTELKRKYYLLFVLKKRHIDSIGCTLFSGKAKYVFHGCTLRGLLQEPDTKYY